MYDSIVAVIGVTAVRDLARVFAEDKQSQGCASYGMLGGYKASRTRVYPGTLRLADHSGETPKHVKTRS
jgi:hypothetical protein